MHRRYRDEDKGPSDTESSTGSVMEEIASLRRRIGQLTDVVGSEDLEINELRDTIRSDKSAFSAINGKLNEIEHQLIRQESRELTIPTIYESDGRGHRTQQHEVLKVDLVESDVEEDDESKEELVMVALDEDTYSLMMTNPVMSRDWMLGLLAASFQWAILALILIDLFSDQRSPLNIPYSVPVSVTAGQFLGVFICVGVQTDVLSGTRLAAAMWAEKNWAELLGIEQNNATKMTFSIRVVLPNTMKFISGCLVLTTNFVTIVQSDNIVDLMKDIAALLIISEITEIFFKLAEFGFMGQVFEDHAKIVGETEVQDPFGGGTGSDRNYLRLLVFFFLSVAMSIAVGLLLVGQLNGSFFYQTYPYCMISKEQIAQFGDGRCDGGIMNSVNCDFDGGDCVNYNLAYPTCGSAAPWKIGDGICDQAYNTPECNYDGADCCPFVSVDELGVETRDIRLRDGMCDGGQYSALKCKYDEGDCTTLRQDFPTCDLDELADLFIGSNVPRLGDGLCESAVYNIPECGYENGDCVNCNAVVYNLTWTGDRVCHGGFHNTEECNFDAGDCVEFNKSYPRCQADARLLITEKMQVVPIIGDGICNSGLYNNADCGYEDGDCLLCNELIANISKLGDGVCDGQNYMSPACGLDGGDCMSCDAPRYEIGNGWCSPEYNTEECSWDGGDCVIVNKYPNCTVPLPSLLGNDHCNGGAYNTELCGFDGGDCVLDEDLFQKECDVPEPELLGDGVCQGGSYNTEECNYDKGDCIQFNLEYPGCKAAVPDMLGNGWCSGGDYDTEACGYDGGDCLNAFL